MRALVVDRARSLAFARVSPDPVSPGHFAYQTAGARLYVGMTACLLSMPTMDPARTIATVDRRQVQVEFRAATLAEIRQIDLTAPEVVLPTQVLMTRREFRRAMAPFPFDRSPSNRAPERAPGSLIWAQLASRAGDMILGGRDVNGSPSFPMPLNGDIFFTSAVPQFSPGHSGDSLRSSPMPMTLLDPSSVESAGCLPIIGADGSISCASHECEDCLRVLARNSWTTNIACVCGEVQATSGSDRPPSLGVARA